MLVTIAEMHRCLQCYRKTSSHFEQCPNCGAWGTAQRAAPPAKPLTLADMRRGFDAVERIAIRSDWDAALGDGGAMPGSVVLVYGPGGVGKSTDLLRVASLHRAAVAISERKIEEVDRDIRAVADIDPRRFYPSECRTLRDAIAHFETIGSNVCILDSWNCLASPDPHEIGDLREAIGDGVVFVVCHQTKDGGLRGPETLQHAVNVVIRMQRKHFRVEKNWHGPTVRVPRDVPTFRGRGSSPERKEPPRALRLSCPADRAAAAASSKTARKSRR